MNFWGWLEKRIETRDDILPEQVDVIIGLGMDVSQNGKEASPQSRAVALKALELFLQGKGKNILFTGGYNLAGGPTEAELMAQVISGKVPPENLFLEKKSWRTFQNADSSLPILEEHGWKSAIIIAQQWHSRRARQTFRKRWDKKVKLYIIKSHSAYGDSSMKRLSHPLIFWVWDAIAFVYSYLRGYC